MGPALCEVDDAQGVAGAEPPSSPGVAERVVRDVGPVDALAVNRTVAPARTASAARRRRRTDGKPPMSARVTVRPERVQDVAAIAAVVAAAFANHPRSDGSEPRIVERLRARGALVVSLVAEEESAIVGHVACSPVSVDGRTCGWFGLGPLSVSPAHQRRGVGRALVDEALSTLRAHGARGCVVLGNAAYYGRFGFRADPALRLPGFPEEHFLALVFGASMPSGVVAYDPSFAAAG